MPLEIEAWLDRKVPIYLTGEVIHVQVCVRNLGRACEWLAWGSVHLTSDRTKSGRNTVNEGANTAIQPSAHNVFSSLPIVIFCDLQIPAGESKTFSCDIALPLEGLPPSFRGHLVRFSNRITIGVARIREPVQLSHLPVRILSSIGLESQPKNTNAHPFLTQTPCGTVCQVVSLHIEHMAAPRKPIQFRLASQNGKILRLFLFKKAYRLGDEVVGEIAFDDASLRCIQLSVFLETLECEEGEPFAVTQAQDHILCVALSEAFFRLVIPMNAPPTFHTDSLHLRWRLRFEFVTSLSLELEADDGGAREAPGDDGGAREAPADVAVETQSWHTELFVLPCSPHNIALTDNSLQGQISLSI